MSHATVRRVLAALLTAALTPLLLLVAASPAQAHASLVATDPGEGTVLESSPETVVFSFSEDVQEVPGGVVVYDAEGAELGGATTTVGGAELTLTFDEALDDGTVVITYRVLSRDGHPATGSLSFSVGEPSDTVVTPPSAESGPTTPPWWVSLVRWVGYVGLLLAAGLVAFVVLFLPRDRVADRARAQIVTTARAGAVAGAVAWLVGLPVTASYQLGTGLGGVVDGATWSVLTATEYGVTAAVAVGLIGAVALVDDGSPAHRRGLVAVVAAAVATVAPALTGHTRAATPEALAVGADMVHLLAGATWLGGLVALALALPRMAAQGTTGAVVLTRFSTVAAGVVAVLAVTGTLLAWRIAGSWAALFETTYGRLLLVKIAAALVVIAIAAYNRYRLLPGLQQAERRKERRSGAGLVVRTITAEAGVLLVVLMLTGVLVDRTSQPPAPVSGGLDTSSAVVRDLRLGPITARATLDGQATGRRTVTLELRDVEGNPTEGYDPPTATLKHVRDDLGPVSLQSVAPGVYEAAAQLAFPGTWELTVTLRTAEDSYPAATAEFSLSGGEAQVG
ncbi:CopD family protein [Nocardioides sp. C4-1]|uniref:copper resistance CopC/CopD family protein n=1 Tax=Nocardioides sp. C4-1 TaxID=3151851 RepID=UPI003266C824